ncbi:DUF423 domain-containing protein [Aureimonas frigidaquae]|uniref:DUF423 domain-containing protein n=1 Tax=Aureimonas frigidaquae TaxID=424757 RepID=UPI000785969C|nr:DUF423 domain-containing protein [Aureimonas frigidaquae]
MTRPDPASTILIVFAGLFGAGGVAGAAYAAHATAAPQAAIAAAIALVHAPALLALALAPAHVIALRAIPGAMMVSGVLLFSGDLATRIATGGRLFANAAPSGGMLLMAGWLALAILALAALLRGRR